MRYELSRLHFKWEKSMEKKRKTLTKNSILDFEFEDLIFESMNENH